MDIVGEQYGLSKCGHYIDGLGITDTREKMTLVLCCFLAAWALFEGWIRNRGLPVEAFSQWLLVVDVFHVRCLLMGFQ